jgi:polar amino acid transport system substrate-binding protein
MRISAIAGKAFSLGLLGALIVFAALAPQHAAAATLDEILKAGEIRVGINPTLAPRAFYNDKNETVGFEPDVAREIAQKMGVKLVLVPVGSPDRIPFLAANRIDIVMGAMSRTPDRAKVIDFTVPLHSENYGIVTRSDTGIAGMADLNKESVTLVEVRGTVMVPVLARLAPNAKMMLLDNYDDRDRAIAQGRASASVDGIDTAAFRLKKYGDTSWKLIGVPELGITWDCLGVAKGNDTLRNYLNVVLFDIHRSGDVEQMWEKWFGRPMDTKVPAIPWY